MHLMGEKLLDQDLVMNVAVSVKIPIFSGGKTRNKVLAAKEELARQQLEEQSLREKMSLDLRKRADELEEAGLELQMKRQNLQQSEENLRISRKAYAVGNQTLSDLLTAQLLWQQSFADFVEAKFEQNIKYVMWQKAAGKIVY
jgi:outer membrane protein TolC